MIMFVTYLLTLSACFSRNYARNYELILMTFYMGLGLVQETKSLDFDLYPEHKPDPRILRKTNFF